MSTPTAAWLAWSVIGLCVALAALAVLLALHSRRATTKSIRIWAWAQSGLAACFCSRPFAYSQRY
jgi:hypothetical protein